MKNKIKILAIMAICLITFFAFTACNLFNSDTDTTSVEVPLQGRLLTSTYTNPQRNVFYITVSTMNIWNNLGFRVNFYCGSGIKRGYRTKNTTGRFTLTTFTFNLNTGSIAQHEIVGFDVIATTGTTLAHRDFVANNKVFTREQDFGFWLRYPPIHINGLWESVVRSYIVNHTNIAQNITLFKSVSRQNPNLTHNERFNKTVSALNTTIVETTFRTNFNPSRPSVSLMME